MKNFNLEIEAIANDYNVAPIFDGVVSEVDYLSSDPKILWVMKEPKSDDEHESWDICDHISTKLKSEFGILKGWEKTFKTLIDVTNGIFNDLQWREDLRPPKYNSDTIDILKKIAFINIKKTAEKPLVHDEGLNDYYKLFRNILLSQIKEFKPDIIIFCSTFDYFRRDLNLGALKKRGICKATSKNGTIYLDVPFPAKPCPDRIYFEDIMSAIKEEREIEESYDTFGISRPKFQLYYWNLKENNLLSILKNDDAASALAYMLDFKNHHNFEIIPHPNCIEISNSQITIALVLRNSFEDEDYRFLQFKPNLHLATLHEWKISHYPLKELHLKFVDQVSWMNTIIARSDDHFARMLQQIKNY